MALNSWKLITCLLPGASYLALVEFHAHELVVGGVAALLFIGTLFAQARALPWQSTLSAAGLIAVLAAILETIDLGKGIPFGRHLGQEASALVRLTPFLWVIILLNARGAVRFFLRRAGPPRNPGFYTLPVASLLATLTWLNLAWAVGRPITLPQGAALFLAALVLIAIATPSLLNKISERDLPSLWHLVLLLAMNGLMLGLRFG